MKRRVLDLRSFDEVIADIEQLERGYSQAGNWDLGRMCHHLAIPIRGAMDGFTGRRPPWFVRLLGPFLVRRMIRKRRMPEGVKVPDELLPPAAVDQPTAIAELKALLRRLAGHPGPWHPSPFGGPLTGEQWRELMLVHCSHHLSFLHPTDGRA